ncbi:MULTISPECIES: META domain-containing protein [Spirosoma]|uniref:META domain-containing protein n=1 Tax=Spirosoma sordidisoli TaxID=2502893 RepID=A0A4Q2UGM0_9BACT|nr:MULTISPECIES: META domain-containing protein [Spirosoma]RYC68294.1 META domain-containing protein [Spirosoma sordidisoli]
MKSLLLLSLTWLLIGACQRGEHVLPENVAQLVGTWQLREPASPYPVTLQLALDTANPPDDVTPFLTSGKSAVNTYSGRMSAALDGMMIVTRLSTTEMAGSTDAMQFEDVYFKNLKSVVRFDITSTNRLRLYFGTPQPGVLEFDKTQ